MNSVPPPVAIERFAVDDAELPLHGSGSESGSTLSLAAGHVHFQFDYAAMSFVAPQKVRYRYILEGVDRAWTDAGARRTAYYTNIPPGKLHLPRASCEQQTASGTRRARRSGSS